MQEKKGQLNSSPHLVRVLGKRINPMSARTKDKSYEYEETNQSLCKLIHFAKRFHPGKIWTQPSDHHTN